MSRYRFLIDQSEVGSIIGSAGSRIKHIRDITGAALSFLKVSIHAKHRVLEIKGDPEQVSNAVLYIARQLIENRGTDDSTITLHWLIQSSFVGAILGKEGKMIKSIITTCNVAARFDRENMGSSTERRLALVGEPEQLKAASLLIVNILIAGQPNKAIQVLYSPDSISKTVPQLTIHENSTKPFLKLRLLILSVDLGAYIGHKGDTIGSFRRQSGANCSILNAPNNCLERIFEISGPVDRVCKAIELVAGWMQMSLSTLVGVPSNSVVFRLLIHKGHIGYIIGQKGASINSIMNLYSVRIHFHSETISEESTEQLLEISGLALGVASAIVHIAGLLVLHDLPENTVFCEYIPAPNISHIPNQKQVYNKDILIPHQVAGFIIGKNGENIARIRQLSGATIIFESQKELDPEKPRTMSISAALPEHVSKASHLINQLLSHYNSKTRQQ